MPREPDLTTDQAATRMQLSPKRVRQLLARGLLRGYRVGLRVWRIPAEALEEFRAGRPREEVVASGRPNRRFTAADHERATARLKARGLL